MARNHSKLLADAQAAGFTDDEQDILDSELDVDLDAENIDEEDSLHNMDAGVDDLQNSSKSKSSSQPAPQKTTQWAISVKRKHKSTKFVQDDTPPPESPTIITYLLTITSASNGKKTKLVKQRESISRRIELPSTEPWDMVKAQFLNEISDALSPPQIHFDHYEFSFKIPRAVPEPTRLVSSGDYEFLVRESMKRKNALNVKVQITQKKVVMKSGSTSTAFKKKGKEKVAETEDSNDDEGPLKKRKKKVSFPKVLHTNINRDTNIQELHGRWPCARPECASSYCFVNENNEHIPLSHEMFDVWAMAMLKGEEHATLENPPSHRLFDSNNLSTVLRQRKEVQEAKRAAASISTSSVGAADILSSFTNFATTLRTPSPLPLAAAQPYSFAVQTMGAPSAPSLTLLPANRKAGSLLTLKDFCYMYQVDDVVCQKLFDEGYKTSSHLQYAMVQELKEAGFRIGEIASLKDACARWSLPYN